MSINSLVPFWSKQETLTGKALQFFIVHIIKVISVSKVFFDFDRSEEEEELKKINKVAEILSGT